MGGGLGVARGGAPGGGGGGGAPGVVAGQLCLFFKKIYLFILCM